MYAVGDIVLYRQTGVCRVESIGPPPFRGNGAAYYKLCPVFAAGGAVIYLPVDAPAAMRPIVSAQEAIGCLERTARLRPAVFRAAKTADAAEHYRRLLSSQSVGDCLRLIKEVRCKERELTARRKKLGQVDAKYLKIAERLVCEELAAALHTVPEEIRERLYTAMAEDPSDTVLESDISPACGA